MTNRRGAAKDRRAAKKKARRRRMHRDKHVTEKYGESGHRSCGRKTRYPDEATALVRASRYTLWGAPQLRAYRCRYCGGWHLTKKELRKDQNMAAREYRVHETTRRAAAIDARLGMDVSDIAESLGIATEVVERSIAEFADASDEELGITTPQHDAMSDTRDQEGQRTFWVVMSDRGEPVTICASEAKALSVASAVNKALYRLGHDEAVHVTSVDAWEE